MLSHLNSHLDSSNSAQISEPVHSPSLLDLPTEVTAIIWRHAFVLSTPIQIYCHPDTECVAFESGRHERDAQIRLRSETLDLPVSLLGTCRRIYHEAAPLLYDENLFEYHTLYSRFPPLTHKDFAILPMGRILSLEKISISTPWFDGMTLNSYRNLRTIIFRYPGDIFLARRDLPSRDHPRTIRPLALSELDGSEGTADGEGDDDGPTRYYEHLNEVDHDALIAYAKRDYTNDSSFYDVRAAVCRGITPSIEIFIKFNLRHLDDSSREEVAERRSREVLIPAEKILRFVALNAEERVATREEILAQRNRWGGLSTLIVP